MAKKELYKDWIVRYYANHDDIPPGHTDGELTELIRCRECRHYTGYECQRSKVSNIRVITNEDDFCSRAERKEHETD